MPDVNDKAPDFSLPTESGDTLSLKSLKGKAVVLYFYPKDDTPGCTRQSCGFRDHYVDIREQNAIVLGISPDNTASHVKFRTKYNLPFTLLSDEDHAVAERYGVWGEKSYMGKKYMGILRSHVVIDEHGRLAALEVDVKPEASVAGALQSLGISA